MGVFGVLRNGRRFAFGEEVNVALRRSAAGRVVHAVGLLSGANWPESVIGIKRQSSGAILSLVVCVRKAGLAHSGGWVAHSIGPHRGLTLFDCS